MSTTIEPIHKYNEEFLKENFSKFSKIDLAELLYDLEKDQFHHKPVGIDQFMDDPYFLGTVYPNIFPLWRKTLQEMFPHPLYSPFYEVIINLGIGTGKCCHKDTLIPTDLGLLTIEDIYNRVMCNEVIRVYAEDGICHIIQVFKHGLQESVKIKSRAGKELEVGLEHKFRVLENESIIWKDARDLKEGDILLCTYSAQPSLKQSIYSREFCYLLGYLVGDGVYKRYQKSYYPVKLVFGDYIDEMPEFKEYIHRVFTEAIVSHIDFTGNPGNKPSETFLFKKRRNNTFVLQASSKKLSNFLYGQRAIDIEGVKNVPDCIMTGSSEEKIAFLEGFFDSDGHFCKTHAENTQKSKKLIDSVQNMLASLGVTSSIRVKKNKVDHGAAYRDYYRLSINRIQSFKKLQDLGFSPKIPYKKSMFEQLANRGHSRNNRNVIEGVRGRLQDLYKRVRVKIGSKEIRKLDNIFGFRCGLQNASVEVLQQIRALFNEEFNQDNVLSYLLDKEVYLDYVQEVSKSSCELYDFQVDSKTSSYIFNDLISHNSTVALIAIAYDIYKLLCMKSPQTFFGLPPHTRIAFQVLSAAKYLAEDVNWEILYTIVTESPCFKDIVDLAPKDQNPTESRVDFPNKISIVLGASLTRTLGRATFSALLDEANFVSRDPEKPYRIYRSLIERLGSRFSQKGGYIPGCVFLVSSPFLATDYLQDQILRSRKSPAAKIITNIPPWEVKDRNTFSDEDFYCFTGDETRDACMAKEREALPPNIEDYEILRVPMDFWDRFQKDLVSSLRDVVGITTSARNALFQHIKPLNLCATAPNRFSREVVTVSFKGPDLIQDYINKDYIRNPMHGFCNRAIHLDLAIGRCRAGIAASYCLFEKDEKTTVEDAILEKSSYYDRFFYTDWVIGIEAKDEEIPAHKLVSFLKWLKDEGYPISIFSADKFNFHLLRQQFRLNNLELDYASPELSRSPFIFFRSLVNAQRVVLPNHNILYNELRGLKDDGKKIQKTDTKDLADAVVCSIQKAAESEKVYRLSSMNLKPDAPKIDNPISILKARLREHAQSGLPGKMSNFFFDR